MKVKTETIVRTVILALALVNQLLSATEHAVLPIQDEQAETLITTGATILASLWAWWKNNSFTREAIAADNHMADLRKG